MLKKKTNQHYISDMAELADMLQLSNYITLAIEKPISADHYLKPSIITTPFRNSGLRYPRCGKGQKVSLMSFVADVICNNTSMTLVMSET